MYGTLQGCVTLHLAEIWNAKPVPGRDYQLLRSSSSYRQISSITTFLFGYLISVIPTQSTSSFWFTNGLYIYNGNFYHDIKS